MGKPISLWTDEVAMGRPNVPEVPVYEAPKNIRMERAEAVHGHYIWSTPDL